MDDRHLDGNAAGGPLSDIFALEATTVMVTCAGCGHRDALGAALLFASGPGTVVRCEGCLGSCCATRGYAGSWSSTSAACAC